MISPPGSRPSRRAGTCRRNSTTRQGSQHMDGDGGTTSQSPDIDAKLRLTRPSRRLVRGTNINAISLLAPDYLHHSNEVVMVLTLGPVQIGSRTVRERCVRLGVLEVEAVVII